MNSMPLNAAGLRLDFITSELPLSTKMLSIQSISVRSLTTWIIQFIVRLGNVSCIILRNWSLIFLSHWLRFLLVFHPKMEDASDIFCFHCVHIFPS